MMLLGPFLVSSVIQMASQNKALASLHSLTCTPLHHKVKFCTLTTDELEELRTRLAKGDTHGVLNRLPRVGKVRSNAERFIGALRVNGDVVSLGPRQWKCDVCKRYVCMCGKARVPGNASVDGRVA